MPERDWTPNPGSYEAREAGCSCPVMDNNHGKWKPWQGDWLISEGCSVHDAGRATADTTEEVDHGRQG